jgi:uncharacterized membrane protein YfcA
MDFLSFFSDYSFLMIIFLITSAFAAGFLDSIVGGGGLIQIPALLISLPGAPVATVFGTNKIAALSGTSIAAYQYAKRVQYNYGLLVIISGVAFTGSFVGARTLSFIDPRILKPLILVILVLIAVYTFIRKDLGALRTKTLPFGKKAVYGSLFALVIGFYDGFFGPGTGSFFIMGFVVVLGFDFLSASAYAKIINCITNLSALIVFLWQGQYLPELALLMAVANSLGSIFGSKLALKKGNGFIRIVFLVIVSLMILRYGYDILLGT